MREIWWKLSLFFCLCQGEKQDECMIRLSLTALQMALFSPPKGTDDAQTSTPFRCPPACVHAATFLLKDSIKSSSIMQVFLFFFFLFSYTVYLSCLLHSHISRNIRLNSLEKQKRVLSRWDQGIWSGANCYTLPALLNSIPTRFDPIPPLSLKLLH